MRLPKELREERDKEICALRLSGLEYSEIACKFDISVSTVKHICETHEIGKQARKKRNQEIVELRNQGYSMAQLAEMFGISVGHICREYGVGGKRSDRKATYKEGTTNQYKKETEDEKRDYVERFLPFGFSYDSGYIDCDHHVNIRCNVCSSVFDASMVTIRKGMKIRCRNCEKLAKEAEQKAKREKLAEERKQRQREKDLEMFLSNYQVECEECGKIFVTRRKHQLCCSPECSKKRNNRVMSVRKDNRIPKEKRIDKGITARRLYKRDGGVCWICGGLCDLNDYITRDGVIICGDNYPSVDHVVPICEGGEDAWDNVRLAHRLCNSRRYFDELCPPSNFLKQSDGTPVWELEKSRLREICHEEKSNKAKITIFSHTISKLKMVL